MAPVAVQALCYRERPEAGDRYQGLRDAVKAGDVAKAKALFAPARTSYEKIEPIAELFSDLDAAVDSAPTTTSRRKRTPRFTGFHHIEYGLFEQNSTEGLAPYRRQTDGKT
ncbi:MAG: imelysin family protein [Rhodospirillales bacterium]